MPLYVSDERYDVKEKHIIGKNRKHYRIFLSSILCIKLFYLLKLRYDAIFFKFGVIKCKLKNNNFRSRVTGNILIRWFGKKKPADIYNVFCLTFQSMILILFSYFISSQADFIMRWLHRQQGQSIMREVGLFPRMEELVSSQGWLFIASVIDGMLFTSFFSMLSKHSTIYIAHECHKSQTVSLLLTLRPYFCSFLEHLKLFHRVRLNIE